jgi:hypothetical protein
VRNALLLFVALSFLSATYAGATEIYGRITSIRGETTCKRLGNSGVGSLKTGDRLQVADLLETGKTGKIQILLSDESLITVMPESSLRVTQYSFENDKSRMSLILSLKRGTARFVQYRERKGGASVKIETDQALIQTSRADMVITASVKQTELFVIAGGASILNSSKLVIGNIWVGENLSVVVNSTKPPTIPTVIPLYQRRRFIKDARHF